MTYELLLECGRRVRVAEIELFDGERVGQLFVMSEQAKKDLGGVSTGLGFWGSPGWVLGGIVVLGAIEHWLSSKAAKRGLRLLQQAEELYCNIKSDGQYFPINQVENNGIPNPDLWKVCLIAERQFKLSAMAAKERKIVVAEHNASFREMLTGKMTRSVKAFWVHIGDPFIYVKESNGTPCAIRWSGVNQFNPD